MANPTDNTSTPTGVPSGGSVNSNPWQQQFVVWSPVAGLPAQSLAAWKQYVASIPPGQTVL